ncbi:MAG TPA: TlpA disulfide reductase family protein [Tepidisphaeraceae bacterium]|jgi:thiol-disulfide isomerase/thioredoxin|nr:TlpA disulfide reductase family protein [Tepidisphaeraceae bacterium]
MKHLASIVAACALGFFAAQARGTINVGDDAKLTYQTVDGKTIDMQKMHGKLLLVDFWATWCGPCMAEAPHMVEINKKYGDKGLQFLGISLDSDKAKMLQVSQASGFTWPQYFDGLGWGNKLWKQWGTDGIPFTVLVGPDGKVLWTGHPSQIDAAISDAFKNHPPHLVDPKILADAGKLLDQIEEKITSNDAKGAVKLLGKVPAAASADTDFAARSKDVQTKLETAATALLEEVDPLIKSGNYTEAVSRLKDISSGLSGLSVSVKAKKKLAEVLAKPEAKAALAESAKAAEAADRNAKADEALAAAVKLKDAKKDDLAYAHFKQVAKDFADTDAATTAAGEVKAYEKRDPDIMKRANESAASGKAKAALSVAQSYRRAGRADLAKAKYQSIITDFPGTSFAETAKEEMSAMGE